MLLMLIYNFNNQMHLIKESKINTRKYKKRFKWKKNKETNKLRMNTKKKNKKNEEINN